MVDDQAQEPCPKCGNDDPNLIRTAYIRAGDQRIPGRQECLVCYGLGLDVDND